MLKLLEGNGFVTNAEGNCFISELQSKKKHATVWIKIRFVKMGFKHYGQKSSKHMMEDGKQGLTHIMNMSMDQAGLHSLSSQGKPQNTATLATIDRQRNHWKHLTKDFQIT